MPPNAPNNSRLPQLAVWSGYGTEYCINIYFLISFFLLNIISALCTGSNIHVVSFKDYQLRIMQFDRLLRNKCADLSEESRGRCVVN